MRGRDKAPPQTKAEAKARRYQPIIKMVDDWPPQHAPRLTDFPGTMSGPEAVATASRKTLVEVNLMGWRADVSRRARNDARWALSAWFRPAGGRPAQPGPPRRL